MSTRRKRLLVPIFIVAALSVAGLVFVSARNITRSKTPDKLIAARPTQSRDKSSRRRNLSVQQEAVRMSRRLGQRFSSDNRERSIMSGTVRIGSEQRVMQATRTPADDGERVEVVLSGGLGLLTWDASNGALSVNGQAKETDRQLIERLVFDSPDQFVLAQLRGASYYTVARGVRPENVGGSDDYAGPLWDLVRVSELEHQGQNKPQSASRLYYINNQTGMIDKVLSQEDGEVIVAEISGWTNQGAEKVPTRITWKRNDQTVMEFLVSNVVYQRLP